MRSGRSPEVVTLHKDLAEEKEQAAGQGCSKQKKESEQRPYGGNVLAVFKELWGTLSKGEEK